VQLFYEPNISNDEFYLNDEESRHCIKVLRKKKGDEINVVDGKGTFYQCLLLVDHQKKCLLRIKNTRSEIHKDYYIHIAIAPTKNLDRIEWFVEKAVEIGVDEISFIITKNSERRHLKIDRLEKKAVSAMKQSLKAILPKLNDPILYSSFIKSDLPHQKYIGYVDIDNPVLLKNAAPANNQYCMLIGPEGDFTETELKEAIVNNFKKVSLGTSRLRTETAGIVACHLLNIINS
jgi:16S rRNA (uracil1498-N3)-methyltransferase